MRKPVHLACGALAAIVLAAHSPPARAHAVVGARFFPATLATDDPAVADELSLPTIASFKTGDDPAVRQLDISGEYAKRLTSRLGVSLEETWTHLGDPENAAGFQNIETTVKYQFLTSPEHEAILAAGLGVEWSGSGAERVGAEHHTTITPTLYFGKGFGDLPESVSWARPFAMTGLVGYSIPSRGHDGEEANPKVLSYGMALEYSLPYLRAQVKDLGLPAFLNHLTPLVEARFETPLDAPGSRTTGSINPGVIWAGRRFQVGAEAVIPVNRDSGRGVGWMVQLHLYLDDLFPSSLRKPIW
ncbi:MAG TPA: hypothetical protein VFE03_14525 [Caulobacteraceae bacterium]|nr:hypothetical protein [Caulobacteraceae bacterium]